MGKVSVCFLLYKNSWCSSEWFVANIFPLCFGIHSVNRVAANEKNTFATLYAQDTVRLLWGKRWWSKWLKGTLEDLWVVCYLVLHDLTTPEPYLYLYLLWQVLWICHPENLWCFSNLSSTFSCLPALVYFNHVKVSQLIKQHF